MHFLVSIKVMHEFLKWGGLGGCLNTFKAKPRQASQYIKGLEKLWFLVKTINFYNDPKETGAFFKFT